MTVTGTREKALLSETPVSVGAIKTEVIRETAPLHPGQLLGQIPGVAVAVTNGEGHTTAIRQRYLSTYSSAASPTLNIMILPPFALMYSKGESS